MNIDITGNVFGPSSSTDNTIARYDGTTGKTIQGYSSNSPTISDAGVFTIPDLAAASGLSNLIFSSDTGLLAPISSILYNPAYQGPGSDEPARAILVFNKGLTLNPTYTHTTLSTEGFYSNVTYTPTADATSGNMRSLFASVHATGSNAAYIITAVDAFSQIDSGQAYLTAIGGTFVATVAAASTSTSGGIIGVQASAIQQHASASTPTIISVSADPTNGGTRTLLGTITGAYYGIRVTGMSTASAAAVGSRAGLYINTMAGTVTGTDYGIFVEATQTNKLTGPLSLGKGSNNAGTIAFNNATNNNILNLTTGVTSTTYTITFPLAAPSVDDYVLSAKTTGVCAWIAGGGSSGATTALNNLASVAINAGLVLATNDAFALGSASKSWADLFLASGGVINWNNGAITLTQNSGNITLAGSGTASLIVTSGGVLAGSIIGGSGTTTQLNIYPTAGTGASGADILFKNGTNGGTERMRLLHEGQFGIGVTAPTAMLHLLAGTTAASTAPLKFNSGSLQTTAEAGAVEFLTDKFYGTITTGAARKTFAFLESPVLVTPNIGVASGTSFAGATIALTGALTGTQSINATSTDGLVLTNTTAAANNAQQWSPRIRLTGQGWGTTGSASQAIDWIAEAVPVQGTVPTSNLVVSSQINAGGYTARFTLSSAGALTSLVSVSASGGFVFAGFNSTLVPDATGIAALRSTTTAQKFRIYNTFTTVTTAGEWAKFDWITTANQFRIGTVNGTSTGTARVLSIDYGGLEASPTAAIKIDLVANGITICSATTEKLGYYGVTPVVQQTRGATLTNNVTSGGTTDQIDDFTSLTLYSTDAAAIRNDIYQLARALRQHDVALRALGLLS